MSRGRAQREFFRRAARAAHSFVGDGVFCRGIVEISNYCRKNCDYCGLRSQNACIRRYRLSAGQVLQTADTIASCGIRTVVLQSGDDPGLPAHGIADLIRRIKSMRDMAVTLSLGERPRDDYALWRQAGADRYLLKIETTDERLYNALHGGEGFKRRIRCLEYLRALGYQVGSGIMTGLPGQSIESIARDIMFFRDRNFDMIGIGPFIPHPRTPLARVPRVPIGLTLNVIALTRIVTGRAHIPATTALGAGHRDAHVRALRAGANVLMVNFTPQPFRGLYDIYPGRKRVAVSRVRSWIEETARRAGKYVDYSRGDGVSYGTHA